MLAVVRWVVTLGALVLVFRVLGTEAIVTQLRAVSLPWLVMAVGALTLQIALSAARWRITAGAVGLQVGRGQALREYYLSVLGNTVLPGGVLGDLGRIARLRHQAGVGRAAQSVVIERLAGQIALFAVTGLGAVAWFWPHPAALAGAIALVAGGYGMIVVIRNAGQRPASQPTGRIGRMLRLLADAWVSPGVWRRQLWLSLAILACNLGGFWAAAQAVGLTLGPVAAIFVIPLALSAMLIPLSVNGWGLREGAAAAIWPLAGAAPSHAVAASVVFGIAALLAALPGIVALRAPLKAT
ncbi:lysylphosphatidylglycerol synthase transmembrane domain-containing protein [Roseicitreum antarcticum]|nr:lysylphosphatidylglycerol synthase transmembrane domain-containing protein [Roseicitreum antarcticum]